MWQQFYKRWRDSSTSSKFINTFPYMLELGVDPEGNCCIAYCISANVITENPEEWRSPGSPVSMHLYDQIPTPCDDSPAHPFSRRNCLSKVHASAADFSWSNRTLV